jgi:hypothetical protein
MKKQFTPEEIRKIVEAGGADYVEGAGNWGDGKGRYIMVNEKTSGSSIMIYESELTPEIVKEKCERKRKQFEEERK